MSAAFDDLKQRVGAFGPLGRQPGTRWRPFTDESGNAAFDEWRKTEMEKLDEQRRTLDQAEKDFAEHRDGLRRARDRDEFERFMASRQPKPTP